MSVLIVGSTALDSIKTPTAENPRLLGGSASHAAVAASFFSPVNLVGVVGDDFPKKYVQLYHKHGIDLAGLQRKPGKTFHWSGEYEVNMNNRRTLLTELGVFETFSPELPKAYQASPFVLLANIAPALQHHVLDQMKRPKFVVADTMDLWLNIALAGSYEAAPASGRFRAQRQRGASVDAGRQRLRRAEEDSQARVRNTSSSRKVRTARFLSGPKGFFICPAYPLHTVVDPTGAGDSFVGGMMGYLATARGSVDANIRRAMIYGSVVASFCCEGFGLNRTTKRHAQTSRAAA